MHHLWSGQRAAQIERVAMMQVWADYFDELREAGRAISGVPIPLLSD